MTGEGGERAPKATVSLRQVKKISAEVEHDDDVKSRFTEYSMTSSILPRSEGALVSPLIAHCPSHRLFAQS